MKIVKIKNIEQAKADLTELIQSAIQGEEVIISEAGKPVVRLVRYTPEPRKPGYWQGQVKMADDFDATSEDVISSFMGEEA